MTEPPPSQADAVMPEFTLCFGGEPKELSASTFLSCLLSVANVVEELNREYGDGQRVELRVRAPEPGSLLIDLLLTPPTAFGVAAITLFSGDTLKLASTIISTLSSLLNIRKHLKKDPPAKLEEKAGNTLVHNSNGATMIVDTRIFNIYAMNTTIGMQFDRAFQALDADPTVTRFEVTDFAKSPLFVAERSEFSELSAGAPVVKDSEHRVVNRVPVSIVKVSFDHGLKWEFLYSGNRIAAYVADDPFWSAVDRQDEAFTKGDVLDVDLQIDQLWDQGLKAYVNRVYKVLKVHGHIKPGKQAGLPFS